MNLDDLTPAQRARVLAGAKRVRLDRGALAYAPGDDAADVYVVHAGRIKLVRTNASGAEAIVGIRTAGELFGELAALTASRRSTSAIAMEPATLDALPLAALTDALAADAGLARAFARGVARRLAAAEHELAELLGKSVAGRLVDALGRLGAEHGTPEGTTIRIGINLTHQDLADVIGTSRETLTKELGVLADLGLIRVAHKTITLVQPQAFPFAKQALRPGPGDA